MSEGALLQPGERCGPYRVERILGRGGMGIVYLATNDEGERRALKTLRFGGKLKEQLVERFKQEILLLASIDHVHVVRFYDAGRLERAGATTVWFALEYLEGKTLRQVITERPDGIEIENVARWGRHIADGVGAAHRLHVVHRDLKPENAALHGDVVKVFDLGIAKWRGAMKATAANMRMGTLAYMAPEQLSPTLGEVDARTDVYALGLVLYELATGRHPLVDHRQSVSPLEVQARILNMEPPRLRELRAAAPPELEAIVARCMHKQPSQRFATMREVSDALEDALIQIRTQRHAASFADLGMAEANARAAMARRSKTPLGVDATPPPVVSPGEPQGSTPGPSPTAPFPAGPEPTAVDPAPGAGAASPLAPTVAAASSLAAASSPMRAAEGNAPRARRGEGPRWVAPVVIAGAALLGLTAAGVRSLLRQAATPAATTAGADEGPAGDDPLPERPPPTATSDAEPDAETATAPPAAPTAAAAATPTASASSPSSAAPPPSPSPRPVPRPWPKPAKPNTKDVLL